MPVAPTKTAAKTSTAASAAAASAAVTAPVAEAVKQIEEAVAVHKETIENVVKAGADAATKSVEKAVTLTKEQVDAAAKANTAAFQGYEDLLAFSKDNVDALVRSSSILMRGMQDLSKSVISLTQAQIDEALVVSKALTTAKSLKEMVELSSAVAKENFDRLMAESSRFQQLSAKTAEEALAPLSSRLEAVLSHLTKTAA